jgi:alpha-tubulin suppressor-like RCC1 family protein
MTIQLLVYPWFLLLLFISHSSQAADQIIEISSGEKHTCVLMSTGMVKCWGDNNFGQLGKGDSTDWGTNPQQMGDALTPINFGPGVKVKSISAGGFHTCAVLETDALKCWGWNEDGQLGLGDTNSRGDSPATTPNQLPAINLGANRKVKGVSAGGYHTCALLDNDTVKCWGISDVGQLGLESNNSFGNQANTMGDSLPIVNLGKGLTPISIISGWAHSCAQLSDGTAKCWGWNEFGQLGIGDKLDRGIQSKQMGEDLVAISFGPNKKITKLVPGQHHTCAHLSDLSMRCWGKNDRGQLGVEDNDNRGDSPANSGTRLDEVKIKLPIKQMGVGLNHSCAILINQTVYCWGQNSSGALGQGSTLDRGGRPGDLSEDLVPVALGTLAIVKKISIGGEHSCAILDDYTVKCWGLNDSGQLGQGDTQNRGDGAGSMGSLLLPIRL